MCNVLVSLTKRPNPVSGSFRHLNKYITHRTTANSQLTSSEGFPIFFTAPMTAPTVGRGSKFLNNRVFFTQHPLRRPGHYRGRFRSVHFCLLPGGEHDAGRGTVHTENRPPRKSSGRQQRADARSVEEGHRGEARSARNDLSLRKRAVQYGTVG